VEALSQFFDPNTEHFRQLIAAIVAFSALFLLRSFKGKLLEQSQDNLFGASLYASYAPAKSFLLLASQAFLHQGLLCHYFQCYFYSIWDCFYQAAVRMN